MELLQAQVNKEGRIESNFDDVQKQLIETLDTYKGIVVTEDTVTASKKDVAEIRKIKTSIDDARKNVKEQWMQPYTEFENRCKKLLELCDEPINEISEQVKVFEEQKKAEKKKLVEEIYEKSIGEYREYLPLDSIFDKKWLNASTKKRDIEYDISAKKTHIMSDINVIKALRSEIEPDILDAYKRSGNSLAAAIERNQTYIQDKSSVEAQVREEIKNEPVKEDHKPKAEMMGELNDFIEMTKTVSFTVSKDDEETVEEMLKFSGINYSKNN